MSCPAPPFLVMHAIHVHAYKQKGLGADRDIKQSTIHTPLQARHSAMSRLCLRSFWERCLLSTLPLRPLFGGCIP